MGRKDLCGFGTSFDSKRWLSIDACGILGITLSWGVHFFALFVIASKLISNSLVSTALFFGVYLPVAFLAMSSLFMASTTDPGAVPLGARPLTRVRRASTESGGSSVSAVAPSRAIRRCHKCNDNYKPNRAHHDSVTGRCIVKFDHFCPWVNNAVGALNHKFFCLFLLYTAISCLLSMVFLILRVIHCGYITENQEAIKSDFFNGGQQEPGVARDEDSRIRHLSSETQYLYPECNNLYDSHLVLGLFVASIVFLVFTCSMGCEQIEAIESGKGKIARMKMRVGQAGTEFATVTEEFNEMFGGCSPKATWHWFVPTKVWFPGSMRKVVLGYEWDESFADQAYQEPDDASDSSATSSHNVRTSSDIEMQVLSQEERSQSLGLTNNERPANLTLSRASSDVSIPESQKSLSTRNRRTGSRLSEDASLPKIV